MLLANAENWADKHADLKIRQTDMEFCMRYGCSWAAGSDWGNRFPQE